MSVGISTTPQKNVLLQGHGGGQAPHGAVGPVKKRQNSNNVSLFLRIEDEAVLLLL
jgi:hypothetical protein